MDLEQLHKHSLRNRDELSRSEKCGCFSCRRIFSPSEIEWWIDEDNTAMCPYCDIDAVIGDACGVEITPELIDEMYKRFFEISEDEVGEEEEVLYEYEDDDEDYEWNDEWNEEDQDQDQDCEEEEDKEDQEEEDEDEEDRSIK